VSAGEAYKGKYPLFEDFEAMQKEWAYVDPSGKPQPREGQSTWPRSRLKDLRNALGKSDVEADEIIKWCKSRGYLLPEKFLSQKNETQETDAEIKKSNYAALFDVLELADVYENIAGKEVTAHVHKG
jgi:hypothetical protein